jgi:hypothetical protein
MWQSWKVFASCWHTILGAHHALELCTYIEHKICSLSLEFKFGTSVPDSNAVLVYQIQMRNHYPINRTLKLENFGAHSCVKA